jgi:hypothetical protein
MSEEEFLKLTADEQTPYRRCAACQNYFQYEDEFEAAFHSQPDHVEVLRRERKEHPDAA